MATLSEVLAAAFQFHQAGRLAEAETLYRRILAIQPDHCDALHLFGITAGQAGRLDEAITVLERAVALAADQPAFRDNLVIAHNNLGQNRLRQGRIAEAIESYRTALAIQPGRADLASNLVFALNYLEGPSAADLRTASETLCRQHFPPPDPAAAAGFIQDRQPDRPLRVGYVATNFQPHSVLNYFVMPALRVHDPRQLRAYVYASGPIAPGLMSELAGRNIGWRAVNGADGEAVRDQIRKDAIDILVDLDGHSGNNRLPVFACRAAPLQVTWAGYAGTTGLPAMDYLISDHHETPADTDHHYTERLVRLPDGYVGYRPPPADRPVSPLPALALGRITFGCLNNPSKYGPAVIALWSRLLHALPEARLVLRHSALAKPETHDRFRDAFRDAGLDETRVVLGEGGSQETFIACYDAIDIALDPFPYSGGITTLEALWMGVPVITLGGDRFCARHSVSHLTTVGLPGLIAADPDAYLRLARDLAADRSRLQHLRASLRPRLAASPLCDGVRFARHLEAAYRAMWRRWCAGLPPTALTVTPHSP